MTYPAFPTMPSGAQFYTKPLRGSDHYLYRQDEFAYGAISSMEDGVYPIRELELIGAPLPEADFHAMMGFLFHRRGGANPFYAPASTMKVWDVYDAATLSQAAGGALGGRTYYVKYAWSDGTYVTRPGQEGSYAVGANNLLTVTVDDFPRAVTEAWIYIGLSTGIEKYVAKVSTTGGTFTEPYTTVNGDSAAAQPILNVASETNYQAGMPVLIGAGTAREETKTILSVAAGALTMTENLTYQHLAVDADSVRISTTAGASPATENNFYESPLVVLVSGPDWTFRNLTTYEIRFGIREVFPA